MCGYAEGGILDCGSDAQPSDVRCVIGKDLDLGDGDDVVIMLQGQIVPPMDNRTIRDIVLSYLVLPLPLPWLFLVLSPFRRIYSYVLACLLHVTMLALDTEPPVVHWVLGRIKVLSWVSSLPRPLILDLSHMATNGCSCTILQTLPMEVTSVEVWPSTIWSLTIPQRPRRSSH